jgi:tetratricopeptide (TPR) repeat protein
MMELHTALDNDLSLTQAQRSQQQSKLLKAVGWFQKGIKIRGSTESALDCFKQAYVVYDTHIPSIFNMAISYDLIGKYKCAIKYFQIVIDIKPSMDQAYFGACLSNLKIADYNQALMYIDQAIIIIESHIVEDRKARNIVWFSEPIDARSTSKTYEATLVDALYLKSLLLRLMKRYEEATKTYKQVRKFCAYEEKKGLIETAFGMMLIGLSDRRKAMDWTDKMLYYIKFYSDRYSTIKDPILQFYNKNEREWTNPKRAIELLLRKPFFKRFTAE